MATGSVQIADIIVPEIFTSYVQKLTEEKSRLVQSGVLVRQPLIDQLLAGGGLTFNLPAFDDLDNDAENISTDDVADMIALSTSGGTPALPGSFNDSIPNKLGTFQEIAVRMSRNNSWSSTDLAGTLAGADPMGAISNRVAAYWTRRLQAAFIATMNGVFKDNDANDAGDYTNDVSGAGYTAGVTDFTAEGFIDAVLTMGDSMDDLGMIMVHSVVYSRMQKNNLIDFIPDAVGVIRIPTYLGREVIIDDGLPFSGSIYESWIFGAGAVGLGVGTPPTATEIARHAAAGQGSGQDVLHSRVEWTIHPQGHAYTGTAANGGPGNGTGANDLDNAGSWDRRYPERKQVKVARYITRES